MLLGKSSHGRSGVVALAALLQVTQSTVYISYPALGTGSRRRGVEICIVRRSCGEAPVHSHLPWPGYAVRFCCSASKRLLVSRRTVLEDFPMPMLRLRMLAAS